MSSQHLRFHLNRPLALTLVMAYLILRAARRSLQFPVHLHLSPLIAGATSAAMALVPMSSLVLWEPPL